MRFEQQTSTCARLAAAAAVASVLFASGRGVSASGQTPSQPQAAPAQPAQPADARATLRITQDEAVKMALENNLGIQVERLEPRIQALAVSQALSAYTPEVFATTTRSSDASPPTDFLQQGVPVTTTGLFSATAGVRQNLPWGGGNYSIGLNGTRFTSDAPRTPFSPRLSSDMDFVINQPLLRGFKIDGFRRSILVSRNQQDIADIQLAERVTQTSRAVRLGYYNLIAAISGLQVAQQSLDLARQTLRNNERRVEVGTMAPIDIVSAQAEVARTEEAVIQRQGDIEAAEDSLRTLILNPTQPDFWANRLTPAEQPVLTPQDVDVDAAVRNALANRTDLAQLREQLDNANIGIKFNQNERLPNVDLQARYGLSGVGGILRQFGATPEGGGLPPITAESQRSFGDVLSDVFSNDFRNWQFSFNVSYPIGTSTADAALAASRLQRQQAEVGLRDLETNITRQVREAARQVSTSLKRVEATRKARELAERSLEAEEKRQSVGLSDSFRVVQYQRDLSNARFNELNAIISYNVALVNLEAVQVVPLGGF